MYCTNHIPYSSMAYLTPNVKKCMKIKWQNFLSLITGYVHVFDIVFVTIGRIIIVFFIKKGKHYKHSYQSGAGYEVKGKTLNAPDHNVIFLLLVCKTAQPQVKMRRHLRHSSRQTFTANT